MAIVTRENFVLHKLHSLSGIIPVGFYMIQHLTLNSFTLAGVDKYNGVIDFFEALPKHILILLEVCVIWIPLLFHSVYGMFIYGRAKSNFVGTRYGWSENRMYWLQRVSGVVIFFFLCYHTATTTIAKYLSGHADDLKYAGMHASLSAFFGIPVLIYMVGILAASYHLCYGIWNFCIRWGITVSDAAQVQIQKISFGLFILVTLLGWAALGGFFLHNPTSSSTVQAALIR